MARIVIYGGQPLRGRVPIETAKNAVLPALAASLLTTDEVILDRVPPLHDVFTMIQLLLRLGVRISTERLGTVRLRAAEPLQVETPYDLVRRMRASILVMGPLLARLGQARASMPGGCAIGNRPVDLHLKGLQALGAQMELRHGFMEVRAARLRGSRVYLDYPSVTATENVLMAAVLAEGRTSIENAAEEPEVVDLANLLIAMGARIQGAGTKLIQVEGVDALHGCSYTCIPDRIEAGTYLAAVGITGGEALLENVIAEHLHPVLAKAREAGLEVEAEEGTLRVAAPRRPRAVDVKSLPYPGFPTDMQAPMMALMSVAEGTSIITESVFENRFHHVVELRRMGSDVHIEGASAIVRGVERLTGAPVRATDLRAGAALVLAGLAAEGRTEVAGVAHIDRGYANLVGKLQSLGARIQRVEG